MLAFFQRLLRRAARSVIDASVESRIVLSKQIFHLPSPLIEGLRRVRDSIGHDEITRAYDAFLLDAGLGPATYLTTDGRVLWHDDGWGVKGTRAEALAAVSAGVHKAGLAQLSDLLPEKPSDAVDCVDCAGTGRFDAHGQLMDASGVVFSVVCVTCAGVGWRAESLPLQESVLEKLVSG
jgi:hypothetical protein